MSAADADSAGATEDPVVAQPAPPVQPNKQRRGFFSRLWRGIFGGRSEDYEKRLQYLSKEEGAVHARMKRRAQTSRQIVRNLIILSVILEECSRRGVDYLFFMVLFWEPCDNHKTLWNLQLTTLVFYAILVVAVVCAIVTTRSADLNWQMRAIRVLPMFLLPGLSSVIYSTFVSFMRMFDRKDQKTLEKLRAERKAKIDELKERTNYYATQQLIQKYDLDPAAKAAAATVLASKLGADSGLKVYVGDEPKTSAPSGKSSDAEPVQTPGLRKRKQSHVRNISTGSTDTSQSVSEAPYKLGVHGQEIPAQTPKVVEHYQGSGSGNDGWIARIASLLVGEDPSQSYALICGNCHMHNGLARKEDFPYVTYYCPHCHALNTSRQSGEHDSGSGSGRGSADLNFDHSAPRVEVTSNAAKVPELLPIEKSDEKDMTAS